MLNKAEDNKQGCLKEGRRKKGILGYYWRIRNEDGEEKDPSLTGIVAQEIDKAPKRQLTNNVFQRPGQLVPTAVLLTTGISQPSAASTSHQDLGTPLESSRTDPSFLSTHLPSDYYHNNRLAPERLPQYANPSSTSFNY